MKERDTSWVSETEVNEFTRNTEYLFLPCCGAFFDETIRRITVAQIKVLKKINIDFGIILEHKTCCGDIAKNTGNRRLLMRLASRNITLFDNKGVQKIIASSPHCYSIIKNDYPEFKGKYEIYHITQIIKDAILDGRLKFKNEKKIKLTFQDPCHLGKYNKDYDSPRDIIKGIRDIEFVEMAKSRENSLCCGGGGGGVWLRDEKQKNLSDTRVIDALSTGAQILATCCPFCAIMFEKSITEKDLYSKIKVKDISEIVLSKL